jgi:transaldolase/glucose-6-phosphate isomerase
MTEHHAGMGWKLGSAAEAVDQCLKDWVATDIVQRLWEKDHRLWSPSPVPEIEDRLGWLSLPQSMVHARSDIMEFSASIQDRGTTYVVLLGMGGSSLAPGVFQSTFGNTSGFPELIVLDSTHPDSVKSIERQIDITKTLFLVSSKSGTTTETLSLFQYFWNKVAARSSVPGDSFAAISDPGTPLQRLAVDRGFLRTFDADPEVGGRYSALSHFGLVPAALIGVDIGRIIEHSADMAIRCSREPLDNPGTRLGSAIGTFAATGRDKLTFVASSRLAEFASWAEQLIAESTGKGGKGIVPVVGENVVGPDSYGSDRVFVRLELAGDEGESERTTAVAALSKAGHPVIDIRLSDPYEIAGEFYRWEFAVALAGSVLEINPFDQPDVQFAKDLAMEAMNTRSDAGTEPSSLDATVASIDASDAHSLQAAVRSWLRHGSTRGYVAIQAYLNQTEETDSLLQEVRSRLHHVARLASTVGYGPRFLHSTGQLHKGGSERVLFLQLVDIDGTDAVPVPETDYTFRELISAQAAGDLLALQRRGRYVLRIDLARSVIDGLRALNRALGSATDV